MAEMSTASTTNNLCAGHTEAVIRLSIDGGFFDGLPETGPASAGFKFVFGRKQWLTTTGTPVRSLHLTIMIFPAERLLGIGLSQNLKLLPGKRLSPFVLGLWKFFFHI